MSGNNFRILKKTAGILLASILVVSLSFAVSGTERSEAASGKTVINKAVSWATKAAANPRIGYTLNMNRRWGPYDYDCGTLVTTAYRKAGLSLAGFGCVGNSMVTIYKSNGFKWITSYNLNSYTNLKKGDVLVDKDQHTEMYIGNGKLVGAHWDWDGVTGDSNGREVSVQNYYNNSGHIHWDGVLRYVGTASLPMITSASVNKDWYSKDDKVQFTMAGKNHKSRSVAVYKTSGEKVLSVSVPSSGKVSVAASKVGTGHFYAIFSSKNSDGTKKSGNKSFSVNTVPTYSSVAVSDSVIGKGKDLGISVSKVEDASSQNLVIVNKVTGATISKSASSSAKINALNPGLYKTYYILKNPAGETVTKAVSFRVTGKVVKKLGYASANTKSFTYNGKKKSVTAAVYDSNYNKVSSKYYTLKYKNSRVNAGNVEVNAVGANGYSGKSVFSFKINPKSASSAKLSSIKAKKYTGQLIVPNASVTLGSKKLVKGKDYTLTAVNKNTKGTLTAKFTGNYTGMTSRAFTIKKAKLSSFKPHLSVTSVIYNRVYQEPEVVAGTLTDEDYTVTYKNNYNAGTASVNVKAKGMVTGSKALKFKITKKELTDAAVAPGTYIYTGKAIKPAVTCEALPEKMCTVRYFNNVDAGTGVVTFTGKGNYSGTLAKTFQIQRRSIEEGSIAGLFNHLYTGKAVSEDPKLVLPGYKEVTWKTIWATRRTGIGKHTVTLEGTGNYQGRVNGTFIIYPRKVSKPKVTGKKKALTVKFTPLKGGPGYQIAYRKAGSSKWVVKTVGKRTGYTIKKLAKKKKYIVKVRGYKNSIYGSWSRPVDVITK